ncbi:glycogen debranching N-terminal domain-containing protein [Caulobacter sp. 17J80-11]|uniref:amylo-alpha-1,6-glucosidase n=1 Tax=Caulobacter sp. 17J80-11 TaxID=2763502 RepID=UPI001653A189|nr:glycogen debranching N-terminal domain-containing protein [Caulobacter sp. 17J80-11]MBC6980556.1 hypothetical protein [Caulobacter sp. 17J80-11]
MTEVVQPVMIKAGELFLVARADGAVPAGNDDGFGLFFRDSRYLQRYELTLGGQPPMALMSSSARGAMAVLELANNRFTTDHGFVEQQSIGVRWERTLDPDRAALVERLRIRNFMTEPLHAPLTLSFGGRFEDLFEVRGYAPASAGQLRPPRRRGRRMLMRYDGADRTVRRMALRFSRPPRFAEAPGGETAAHFAFTLAPQEAVDLTLELRLGERSADAPRAAPRARKGPAPAGWLHSDDARLNVAIERSLSDLRMLQSGRDPDYVAGGLPWFVALFGRDSITAAIQSLAFDPEIAAGTLRALARWQGRRFDPRTGEEPGKILHELRVGEMARLGAIPFTPGYQSVDSTPLFLVLLGLHARWTGRLDLFLELREAAEAALAWLQARMTDGLEGFLDYDGVTPEGPINQAWKDSASAVRREDGGLPDPPLALVEVQACAFKALTLSAELFARAGDTARAAGLEAQAQALAGRFDRAFWMEDEDCYCLALERDGRQVRSVTSNAGHALWGGIAPSDKAAPLAARLLREDLFCGWGVRTLSNRSRAYNPVHYHLGSVWPFDNSLIVTGLVDYGHTDTALKIFEGVLAAAGYFSMTRLPEFFVGVQREPGLFPGRCPYADPLQAWSAGALPYMASALLGLRPDGFARTLRIARPTLPAGVNRLRLQTQVAGAPVDCCFERDEDGEVRVEGRGPIQVVRDDHA